jgi:hypothetical protein
MMELSYFLQLCVIFFAVIGYLRGLYKEFVGLAGLTVTLWLMTQFGWVVDWLIGGAGAGQRFIVDAILFIIMIFFSYQQAPTSFAPRNYRSRSGAARIPGAEGWQMRFLGAVFGGINGYVVVGTLWYMMDQLEYPLSPLFSQPALTSGSANFVSNLPLVWLQQGNLLTWLVAGLFLLIIVFR